MSGPQSNGTSLLGRPTEEVVVEVLGDLRRYWHDCHGAALALKRSGALPPDARVARGFVQGVTGQHSWVVLDDDVYKPYAWVIDPTYWSYDDLTSAPYVHVQRAIARGRQYRPHGSGMLSKLPLAGRREPVALEVADAEARAFLKKVGPLDPYGWMRLFNGPMGGWPARTIVAAAYDVDELRALIPIDVAGMLTDRNPGGLYA